MSDRDFRIRRLRAGDAARYRALRLEGLRDSPEAFGSSFEEEAAMPPDWFAARLEAGFVLCGEAGQGSGIVGLRFEDGVKTRHKAGIHGMFVQPAARGSGLAAALLRHAIGHARGKVEDVNLAVTANNLPALRLYERAGFRAYGAEPRALKIGGAYFDEVLMTLRLLPIAAPSPT